MEQKSSKQKRRKYDVTFKEAVQKVILNRCPIPEEAQSLDIDENLIHKWRSRSNLPTNTTVATSTTAQVQFAGVFE